MFLGFLRMSFKVCSELKNSETRFQPKQKDATPCDDISPFSRHKKIAPNV